MADRRLTACNGRVARSDLRGVVEADRFVDPVVRGVAAEAAFLHAAPGGPRDRQLLFGEAFDLLDENGGWAFGVSRRDGYVGYVEAAALGPYVPSTHRVAVRQTHAYPAPDIKIAPTLRLSFGARLAVEDVQGRWARTGAGWVRADHLRRLDAPTGDPVEAAELFLGTPYLWAGNSADGIDCSGLVQAACLACNIACPGDSDLQERALGQALPTTASLRRSDLLFWRGHVAWVADEARLLHATADRMMVTFEPIEAAIARIEAGGDGAVTSRRRL